MQTAAPTVEAIGLRPVNLENPSSSENVWLGYTFRAMKIDEIVAVLRGTTPSVTWNIRYAADRSSGAPTSVFASNQTTTNTTTGVSLTSFLNGTIPAGVHVWLVTTAASGSIAEFSVAASVRGMV